MKTLMVLLMVVMSQSVFAFEKEDTSLDLREAIMESNKDYNEVHKVALQEDNRRIASWNGSDADVIVISEGENASKLNAHPQN